MRLNPTLAENRLAYKLECWNVACSKLRHFSFQKKISKDTDQNAWMCRLVEWAFVVCIQ